MKQSEFIRLVSAVLYPLFIKQNLRQKHGTVNSQLIKNTFFSFKNIRQIYRYKQDLKGGFPLGHSQCYFLFLF